VEANSTGGQGSRRAVAPGDDDDNDDIIGSAKSCCATCNTYSHYMELWGFLGDMSDCTPGFRERLYCLCLFKLFQHRKAC
jgi:hypothetical protein